MEKHFPLFIAPGGVTLDAETTLELIETVIRIYREGQGTAVATTPPAANGSGQHVVQTRTARPRRVIQTSDQITAPTPGHSRRRYTLEVRDGRTLQLPKPTPAMRTVVDFMRKHPAACMPDLIAGTGLQKSTIANLLVELKRQDVLRVDHTK